LSLMSEWRPISKPLGDSPSVKCSAADAAIAQDC
jgi:hypothetical protein